MRRREFIAVLGCTAFGWVVAAHAPRSAASWMEVEVLASTTASLSSFACAVSSRVKSGGAFHLKDDRIKRAVRVLCRAEIAQARVRLGGLIMLAGELPRTTHADVEIFDQAIPD
jgi:hypothetical protein